MSATKKDLTRAQHQRGITLGPPRALGVSAVLIALYYLAPLDQLTGVSLLVSLIIGLVVLAAMTTYQVWAILRAAHPGVRAVEALATQSSLPAAVRGHLLLDVAQQQQQLQRARIDPDRLDLLHRDCLCHGRLRGHFPGQPSGSPGRHGPDDLQPDRPRSGRSVSLSERSSRHAKTTRTAETGN